MTYRLRKCNNMSAWKCNDISAGEIKNGFPELKWEIEIEKFVYPSLE